MALISATHEDLTLDDFLRFLDAHPDARAELIEGEIVLMTGTTVRHEIIGGNIFAALHGPMRARGCFVHKSDVIVRRKDSERFGAAPDVFVRCGEIDQRTRLVPDPVVIFEVLSPSTEARDRAQKFIDYTAIESLLAYVLVRQDEARAEIWTRGEDGVFAPSVARGRDAVVSLPAIGTELSLAAVYEGVDLDA